MEVTATLCMYTTHTQDGCITRLDTVKVQLREALLILYMWQSQVEIEYYSVAYFERITEFDAL